MTRDPFGELARDIIGRSHHGRAAQDERQDEIAEAVGMAEGNDREIAVGSPEAHRRRDLAAVGEEMFRAAGDRLRRAAAARGDLQAADAR
jgi:hypothetical protein